MEMENNTAVADPVEMASGRFLGQWSKLVSTTNWEKGRIIHDWRTALAADGVGSRLYSDEAWSQRVGNVTSQHVGRLRRVYERFISIRDQFPGLFWSHFQAAVDWEDAEVWLVQAWQKSWSVSRMRRARWEELGDPNVPEPKDEEVIQAEVDEDFGRDVEARFGEDDDERSAYDDESSAAAGSVNRAVESGEDDETTGEGGTVVSDSDTASVRPFVDLPELPDDLMEVFDAFKLVVLRHKMEGWKSVSPEVMLSTLDALKQLVHAPSGE